MEEIEEEPPSTPFWVQQKTAFLRTEHHARRRRHQSSTSSIFLNTGVLVLFLILAAAIFLYIVVIPSFINLTQQIFKPPGSISIKKRWDSLNFVLVLFAIVCGFLGRYNQSDSDQSQTTRSFDQDIQQGSDDAVLIRNRSQRSNSTQWYDQYPNNTISSINRMDYLNGYGRSGSMNRLRRAHSSHPDFQRESLWLTQEAAQWRFYDDSYVNLNEYGSPKSQDFNVQPPQKSTQQQPEDNSVVVKNIEVDTFASHRQESSSMMAKPPPTDLTDHPELPPAAFFPPSLLSPATSITSKSPPPSPAVSPIARLPPPPPPPPPPPTLPAYIPAQPTQGSISVLPKPSAHSSNVQKKRITTTHETSRRQNRRERSGIGESEVKKAQPRPTPRPPPPPPDIHPKPPPPTLDRNTESKGNGRSHKKRGGVTVTKEILTSLYHQRKRKKKQRQRSQEESLETEIPSNTRFPPPTPPPPPPPLPPPPSNVFHDLFSTKKSKNKKIQSAAIPPTPPSPPKTSAYHSSKPKKTKIAPEASNKQTFPTRDKGFMRYMNETNSGNASPLIPAPPPPPPPPPPFKMQSWKYIILGDYAKIESNSNSPRSNSELDDDDEETLSSNESPSPMAIGNRIDHNGSPSPFSCPSPDVNTKADNFIARFRDKLKLERMDSIKQGHSLSRLSFQSSLSPSPH